MASVEIKPKRPFTVGMWGTFDVDNYGDLLFPLIARQELGERLPGVRLRVFAPYGSLHPLTLVGGEKSEPLGMWSEEHAKQMAGGLDLVLVGGGDIIHTGSGEAYGRFYGEQPAEVAQMAPSRFFIDGLGPEPGRPLAWNAVGVPFDFTHEHARRVRDALEALSYVSVRDEQSRRRLEAVGARREIHVVPDTGFLLTRAFPIDRLKTYLAFLRVMGRYPRAGPVLILQGNQALVPFAPALASAVMRILEARPGMSVATVEPGQCHGDEAFADAMARALPVSVWRIPPSVGLAGVAAAIAGSTGFVGSSLHANISAFVYGRPHVTLNINGFSKLEGFAEMVEGSAQVALRPEDVPDALEKAEARDPEESSLLLRRLQARVDEHFDRIAQILERAPAFAGNEVST